MLFGRKPEYLIVGLGNPGKDYEKTRHNVGFRVLDLLAQSANVKLTRLRFRGLCATAQVGGKNVLLIEPQTMMNASGLCVEPAASFYKIPPEKIIVVSDEVALPVGKIRVREGGSAGGHNGLKSIIHALGSDAFIRVRVGVGQKPHPDYDLADWVLGKFSEQEETALKTALTNAAEAAADAVQNGSAHAASAFNGR